MGSKEKWPNAAWGESGIRYVSSVTMYPVDRCEQSLSQFLQYPCKPLSQKAAVGFEKRLTTGTVRSPQFFKNAIHDYVMRSNSDV